MVESWSEPVRVVGGVVVGHDGSRGAAAALGWAADDAVRRGCALHVVRAWVLATAIDDVPGERGTVPSMAECADVTLGRLERDVEAVLGARGGVRPPVECHVVHGQAGPALVTASAGADLLVVGHRGHSRLEDLLLGSVAEHALRHATVSVVVVRP